MEALKDDNVIKQFAALSGTQASQEDATPTALSKRCSGQTKVKLIGRKSES